MTLFELLNEFYRVTHPKDARGVYDLKATVKSSWQSSLPHNVTLTLVGQKWMGNYEPMMHDERPLGTAIIDRKTELIMRIEPDTEVRKSDWDNIMLAAPELFA